MYKKPSNLEFAKVFDEAANVYDKITNQYALERRMEFFKKYARGKCLEIGAGSGEISKALLLNHEVVATDISPKMVEVIRKKLKIKAYVCDAEELPFKNRSFDTIIAAELIYYLDHPNRFAKEAKRVLRGGGTLLLSSATKITELYDQVRAFLRRVGFSSMYFEDPNKKFMAEREIRSLLSKNGFKIRTTQAAIVLPFRLLDPLNRVIERTFLKGLCSFAYIAATKP